MALNLGTLTGFLDLDASAFEGALSGAADRLGSFAGSGAAKAAAAGLAVGTALAAGVVGAMNVEAANDKLTAQLGLTQAESERVGKVAGTLYSNAYGSSLEEVNTAVAEVMRGIGGMSNASSADLQKITGTALDFATAMGVDVSEGARSAGILVKTGLADSATEAFDLLTVAAQQAGPAMVQPVLEAANEYGVNFAAMGMSGSDAMAVLVEASKGGEIALDKAGDAVKEFGIRATDLADTGAQDALEALGFSGEEMANKLLAGGETAAGAFGQIVGGLQGVKDPAKQAELAVALFGTPLEDIGKDQLPAFLEAMSQAGTGLGDVAGAAADMGGVLNDNASTNIEAFKRQLSTTFVDVVGGQILPAVSGFAAVLATGLGPAFDAIGAVLSGVVAPAMSAAFGFLAEHSTAVGVIAGVLTAVFIPALVASAASATMAGATIAAFWIAQKLQAIGAAASYGIAFATMIAGWAASAIAATASGIAIAAAWLMALGPIALVIAAVVAIAVAVALNFDKVKAIVSSTWDWLKSASSATWDWIKSTVSNAGSAIVSALSAAWGVVTRATSAAWDVVKSATSSAIDAVVGFVKGLPGKAVDALSALGGMLSTAARVAFTLYLTAMTAVWGTILTYVAGIPGRIVAGIGNLGNLLVDAGGDLLRGLARGITGAIGGVVEAAKDAARSAVSAVKGALGISSPSKVFAALGVNVGQGLALGISGSAGLVGAAAADLAASASAAVIDAPAVTLPAVARARGGDGASVGTAALAGATGGGHGDLLAAVLEQTAVLREELRRQSRDARWDGRSVKDPV